MFALSSINDTNKIEFLSTNFPELIDAYRNIENSL